MAKNDPQYVRLTNRLTRGMCADVAVSGWSIAGYDVVVFPEGREAARFVRQRLNSGILEPASKAEWEEVHENPVEATMLEQRPDFKKKAPIQEARVREAAQEGSRKLQDRRDSEERERAAEEAGQRRPKGRGRGQQQEDPEEETPPE